MSRPLVTHPNWEGELMVHYDYEYDSPAAGFQPLTHVLPMGGRGEDTRMQSGPMGSAQDFIRPDLITSAIGDTTWGMSPMVYGSSRATSAGAPNQHISPNPHYTPSGHAAQSSSIDCYTPLIFASDVGKHETSPQSCHTVGEVDKPGRPSQRRAIKGKTHLHKAYVSQASAFKLKIRHFYHGR
ncbi:hypothetical protein N7528_009174 [Penicillium herquei]|nr:hypothetical protein N7528_009174 [Penicillium herquei]